MVTYTILLVICYRLPFSITQSKVTFLNNTVQREGELGNVDNDGRITERGREYFRKISLQQRKEDPYDNGDPLPPQQMKSLIVDLTGDDIAVFYDVV